MERMNEVRFMGNVGMINVSEKHTYLAVALNESYKAKGADEWTDKTVWVDVVVFGLNRERVSKQDIAKGDGVLVMGKLESSEFEGKRKLQVIANKVQLVQKRNGNGETDKTDKVGETNSPEKTVPPAEPEPVDPEPASVSTDDDDLPF